jgi:hypothetical protein
VRPYWKEHLVAEPLGLTVPVRVADLSVTCVAGPVFTFGGGQYCGVLGEQGPPAALVSAGSPTARTKTSDANTGKQRRKLTATSQTRSGSQAG